MCASPCHCHGHGPRYSLSATMIGALENCSDLYSLKTISVKIDPSSQALRAGQLVRSKQWTSTSLSMNVQFIRVYTHDVRWSIWCVCLFTDVEVGAELSSCRPLGSIVCCALHAHFEDGQLDQEQLSLVRNALPTPVIVQKSKPSTFRVYEETTTEATSRRAMTVTRLCIEFVPIQENPRLCKRYRIPVWQLH